MWSRVFLLTIFCLAPLAAHAVPATVPYVGYLTYDSGGAVDDLVDVLVEIRSDETGGSILWGPFEYIDVVVSDGVFSILLGGSGSPTLGAALASGDALWLDFAIDGQALSGRQQLLSVPFARRAAFAEDAGQLGGHDAADYSLTADLPNAALSGSYADLLDVPTDLASGTGTAGAIAAFSGASTLGDSPLAHSAGKVGVGTTDPQAALHVNGAIQVGMDSATCDGTRAGSLRWTGSALEVCDGSAWEGVGSGDTPTGIGTIANPGLSCYHIKLGDPSATDGTYWLQPNGAVGLFEAYCDMAGGGWTLVARMTIAGQQTHYNTGAVNVAGTGAVMPSTSGTAKFSDAQINAVRTASPYNGTTSFRMTCWEGTGNFDTMFCSSACSFNATASVGTSECSRCTDTFEGALVQLTPNDGTRGLGHHHDGSRPWAMAYQRHPEQGNNFGCKSDNKGDGDGHLWIR